MRVSEIRVNRICVNQGLGVMYLWLYDYILPSNISSALISTKKTFSKKGSLPCHYEHNNIQVKEQL